MSKTSFVLHLDGLSILDKMPDELAGKFLKVLYTYKKTGIMPEMDLTLELATTPFINQFNRDDEKYVKTVEKRILAGSMGGKQKVANASKSKQDVANLADNVNVNVNVKDNDNVNVKDKENDNVPYGDACAGFDFLNFLEFQNAVRTWVRYKSERNQPYKSQESLNLFFKKLKSMSGEDESVAQAIVEQSITAGWSQIFELKPTIGGNGNSPVTRGGPSGENGFRKGNIKFTPRSEK